MNNIKIIAQMYTFKRFINKKKITLKTKQWSNLSISKYDMYLHQNIVFARNKVNNITIV